MSEQRAGEGATSRRHNATGEDAMMPGKKFVAIVLWMVPLSILRGLVLAKLWEWFIADTFGAPTISVAEAIGLSTLIVYVGYAWTHERDDESVTTSVARSVFAAVLCMVVGLVVVQFT